MLSEFSILIAGVGGQGVVMLSELIGNAAVKEGLKVVGSEILGMAVRGGSVVSIVRLGNGVHGPLIPEAKGDMLIGLEVAETLSNLIYMSDSAIILLNEHKVIPVTVTLGQSHYPELKEINKIIRRHVKKLVPINANKLALKAGSQLSVNTVMLGAAFGTGLMPISITAAKEAISVHFPEKLVALNLNAFELGFEITLSKLAGHS